MQSLNSSFLSQALAPYPVRCFESIDSTNQYLLDNIAELENGTICLTEQQTAGRGRRGRSWQSPFGSQIIFSLNWQLDPRKSIEGLSCVVGLAIAQSLRQAGAWANVKWPNDILLESKKLGGILIEISNHKNRRLNLVIGVGINLNLPKQDTEINQAWINLKEVLPDINRNELTVKIIRNVINALQDFEQHGISLKIRQQWLETDAYFNTEVNIISAQNTISGIAQGIDEKGYLQLLLDNGERLTFNAGEVSLRKK